MVISGKKLSEVKSKIENLTGTERIYLSDGSNSPKYIETGQLATKDQLEQKANKDDIPQVDNLVTKQELSGKQDTLKSGENVKTINGQSILGEGNIEIQGGSGGGISDAPSDGKKYVRSNGNWVEETTIDTSSFATKEELNGKISKEEANQAYQPKGDYLTAVPDEYVTETELNDKGYATTTQLSDAVADKLTKTQADEYYQATGDYALKSEIPDVSGFITSSQADGKYATLEQIGNIDAILDSINGEVI